MNTIIIQGTEMVVTSAAAEALKRRDDLVGLARTVPLITDKATAAHATETLRALRSFYKEIEEGRAAAKAPVLTIGRRIDAFATELHGEIQAQGERLSKILGAFNVEQERIAEEQRVAAQAEERRIREEAATKEREEVQRQENLRQQALREVQRQTDEIARKEAEQAARARTDGGRERAAAEAERRRLELEEQARKDEQERQRKAAEKQQARDDAEARQVAENRQALAVATVKPKGTATSTKISYEIVDIVALYEAAPYLVTLSENKSALLSALKGLHGEQKLPGVRHWKEAVTITRG